MLKRDLLQVTLDSDGVGSNPEGSDPEGGPIENTGIIQEAESYRNGWRGPLGAWPRWMDGLEGPGV